MIKKDAKKKKSKLTEDQKREQIAAALKRKKECERKALDIVSREVFLSIKDILPDFRGSHWAFYCINLRSFIITLSYSLDSQLKGLLNFDWFVLSILCNIWDVHQFIAHCLIPLDHCIRMVVKFTCIVD